MSSVRNEVVEGFNDYLSGLKDDESGETFVSLTAFDTVFENWEVAQPISEVEPLGKRYVPRGYTALYDAIANSITETEAQLRKMGREDMKILHVTLTDGGENYSKEYKQYPKSAGSVPGDDGEARLAALVKAKEDQGNWTFVYLGADSYHGTQAATAVAATAMGYQATNAMMYSSTGKGVSRTSESLSSATSSLRSSANARTDNLFADAGQSNEDYGVEEHVVPGGGPTIAVAKQMPDKIAKAKKGDVAKETGNVIETRSLSDVLGGDGR